MYKICVYAICKNELKFVDKWLENMSEADYIVVLDTGSTDGTYEKLKADKRVTAVEQKEIKPWRFDVARNESMKLIPQDADICVCTDFDELFDKGWAEYLRSNWSDKVNRAFYTYAWGQTETGHWHDIFRGDKIHANTKDFHWIYPVHEVVTNDKPQNVVDFGQSLFLYHYQDKNKKRAYYLDLLKLAAEENPNDPHIRALYAREFLVEHNVKDPKNIDNAKKEYLKILELPAVKELMYRSEYLHVLLQLALIEYVFYKNYEKAIFYSLKFLELDDSYRDPYLLLADICLDKQLYKLAEGILNTAKEYTYQHYSWVERQNTFLEWMPTIESQVKFYLGKYEEALAANQKALEFTPDNQDLVNNKLVIQQIIEDANKKEAN